MQERVAYFFLKPSFRFYEFVLSGQQGHPIGRSTGLCLHCQLELINFKFLILRDMDVQLSTTGFRILSAAEIEELCEAMQVVIHGSNIILDLLC